MASPNSMKTESPAKVRMPPMIHKKSETPTDPETAKMPDGVEKTKPWSALSCLSCAHRLTSGADHLIQDDKDSSSVTQLLAVIVDESLVCLDAGMVVCIAWWRRRGFVAGLTRSLAVLLIEGRSHSGSCGSLQPSEVQLRCK